MWQWRFALPPEKGVWVWWTGPILVGVAAAQAITFDFVALCAAAFAGFCVRQPVVVFLNALRRERSAGDRGPALRWVGIFTAVIAASTAWLIYCGHLWLIPLGLVSAPFATWHLWLTARGADRHRMGLDVVAAFVLSLSGPAAYWSCGGGDAMTALAVWLLPALQSSASIVHMFLRLEQRRLKEPPPLSTRLNRAGIPLAHHLSNLIVAVQFVIAGVAHPLAAVAMFIPFAEGAHRAIAPPLGWPIKRLGMRQLFVSSAFFILLTAAMALS